MGGLFQDKTFTTMEELLQHIREQVECANEVGMYLAEGTIKQQTTSGVDYKEAPYTWSAYFAV